MHWLNAAIGKDSPMHLIDWVILGFGLAVVALALALAIHWMWFAKGSDDE